MKLVGQPSRSHSQNSSRCRFLNNRDDSEIPFITVIEAYGYILRKVAGSIQRSDSHKISQHSDMVERPSGVLSAAHVRLIALVGDREQDVRESLGD